VESAAGALALPPTALSTAYQVHSAQAFTLHAPLGPVRPQADALVTATPGVLCGALAADCAPVLIADPQAKVVAAAHAGWRGALSGVVEAAIEAMVALGSSPEHMVAAVGPCIGPASYEVGLEFLDTFVAGEPANARFFAPGASPQKRQFDLPAFVLARLAAAGVAEAEWIGRDTYAEPDLFFSNRRATHQGEKDYGRLLSAIALTPT
jgi:YfiH family protein